MLIVYISISDFNNVQSVECQVQSASEVPVQGLEVKDLSVCSEDGDYSCDHVEDSLDLKD